MNSLVIEGSPKTPSINFDGANGAFLIEGRSIPENSLDFYKPVMEWLDSYINEPQEETNVTIKLEYFNTSSSKCILDVFKKLEAIFKRGKKVIINWHYEIDDEDMLEAGEDYQSIVKIPFTMIEDDE
ncbi:DUF1987 domain-containing protein [Marinifilum caeruleilacunae]|uniref:DUF1987 domain-containing protein n=1 Tax=Marinifilum caeruleilacunae TaxID=2499076 RepID=A0ABX1WWI8_9BACT|nr:DUF1987 domain-containing protein [Marinifilum caeruleilacunae]NOU60301.1 DUF1987 domain-containing protein [Marinifilum caeruleilacunae]